MVKSRRTTLDVKCGCHMGWHTALVEREFVSHVREVHLVCEE